MADKLSPLIQQLKDEMERRDLTAADLAKLADVSTANTYDIMRGDVTPGIDIIDKLARALKLRVVAQ